VGRLARQEAVSLVSEFLAAHGNDPAFAWLAVYQTMLWYDAIGRTKLPHIIEANDLEKPSWAERAKAVDAYIAAALRVRPGSAFRRMDHLMSLPAFTGKQRQNPLGEGFVGALLAVLSTLGAESVSYKPEVPSTDFFPGIRIPGRSSVPRIDIAAVKDERLVAIISAKWSIRHDRLSDITNECPVYKEAAYRHWRTRPLYYFVTNEFSPSRLRRITGDDCVDGVVHVHAKLVTQICGLSAQVLDLEDLIHLTHQW
jgi:hypothetical protein